MATCDCPGVGALAPAGMRIRAERSGRRALFAVCVAVSLGGCASDGAVIGDDTSRELETAAGPVMSTTEGYGFCSSNVPESCSGSLGIEDGFSIPDIAYEGPECLCLRGCAKAADCPTPDEWTAVPICATVQNFETCLLPCANGESCPTGMTCRDGFVDAGPVCIWFDPPEKAVRLEPQACDAYSTPEACESVHADYPVAPTHTCAWATEMTFARGQAGCDPTSSRERCVAVQIDPEMSEGPNCTAPHTCDGESDKPVYWTDVAGDISLVKLETCGAIRPPMGSARTHSQCEFADPAVPTVCDCACAQ